MAERVQELRAAPPPIIAGARVAEPVPAAEGAIPDARWRLRDARAEHYFERDLRGQRAWYGQKAGAYRWRSDAIALGIIVAGALTAFLPALGVGARVAIATAALGVFIAVIQGWQKIAGYTEAWRAYRTASEKMKRERRLYVNGGGRYEGLTDEEAAFVQFVNAVEAILAEEQQLYWASRGGARVNADQEPPPADEPARPPG